MADQLPLHPGLFSWPSKRPELLGSRCLECGEHAFPSQDSCRACGSEQTEIVGLGHSGTLWTLSVQCFLPKSPYLTDVTPDSFLRSGGVLVELPCGLKVESRLRENSPDSLAIGLDMELEIIPVRCNDEGTQLMTFQFCAAEVS